MSSESIGASQKVTSTTQATDREKAALRPVLCRQDKDIVVVLYTKYYADIKRYIGSHISSAVDVEDLTQDVFMAICAAADRNGGCRITKRYLFGVARNVIRNHIRRKRNSRIKTIPIEAIWDARIYSSTMPDQNMAGTLCEQELEAVMCEFQAKLSPAVYEAVALWFFERLSPEEAAYRIGCSVQAFKKRVQRAGRILEGIIKRETTE